MGVASPRYDTSPAASAAGDRLAPQRRGARDLWLLLGCVLVFIAFTVWWLTQDDQAPEWDNGLHTLLAFGIHDQLASGNLTGWFTEFNTYPPLVHLVGAITVFLAGKSPMALIVASNIIFVPLLAFSCYGVARLAYGPRAGLLAGIFALGTPIFVSQMHDVFMIDSPEAAMVAASVWAILASQRFQRVKIAALAGVLVGLGLMTKETSVIFLAGLVAVVVLRGGWRNWRGLLAFLLIAAAISLPWYVYHVAQLHGLVEGQGGTGAAPSAETAPPLRSRASLLWYFWAALNVQLLTPLVLFLLVGVLSSIRDCITRWTPENLGPELLGGAFVSWLGITLIRHKDMRFTMPAIIYIAVLATGWIVLARPRLRLAATACLVAILAINFLAVTIGIGHAIRIVLPDAPASGVPTRQFTLYSPAGYIRGGPEHDGDLLALMRELKRAGVRTVTFDAGSTNIPAFTIYGLEVRAVQAGLTATPVYDPTALGPHDAFMLRHFPAPGDPPPCQRLNDGSGVYVELGNPVKPFQEYTLICPARHPAIYRRTAPPSLEMQIQQHPEILGPSRAMLLRLLLALHRHGVKLMEFDRASANALFFQPTGLERLAAMAQLPVPPALTPQQLTPSDAYLLRKPIAPGAPPPCGRFPDGTGLYVVLGNPTLSHPRYYCPLH